MMQIGARAYCSLVTGRLAFITTIPNGIGIFAERTGNQLGTAVEIVHELTLLKYYGNFQGYLFSKPVPLEQFEALIR